MVGRTGFEPATPPPPEVCATKLRYRPLYVFLKLSSLFVNRKIRLRGDYTLGDGVTSLFCLQNTPFLGFESLKVNSLTPLNPVFVA